MKKKVVKKRGIELKDNQFIELIDILVNANRMAKLEEYVKYRNMIYYMKHDIIKFLITDYPEKLNIKSCYNGEHKLFHIEVNNAVFHIPFGVRYGIKFEDYELIEFVKDFDRDLTIKYEPEELFKHLFEYYVYLNKGIEKIKSGVLKYWYVNEIYKLNEKPKSKIEIKRENGKESNNPGLNTEYSLFIDNTVILKKTFSEFWDIAVKNYDQHFKNIKNE